MGPNRTLFTVAVLAAALLAGAAPGARQRGGASPFPPHDQAIVTPRGETIDATARRLRDAIVSVLEQARILPDGFPQQGTVARAPSGSDPNLVRRSCSAQRAAQQPTKADGACIRLGPESYVTFSVVSYPISRASLFEIWPLEQQPTRTMKFDDLVGLPRIVVEYPFLGDDLKSTRADLHRIMETLQRGVSLAGARPIVVR